MFAAGCLAFVVGLIHSALGERLIFSRMRNGGGIVPTSAEPVLLERHVRILWASWHIVTVFGWALGAVLIRMAFPAGPIELFVRNSVILAMLASSALVVVGTNAKHPGWLGLLGVAVLVWLA